MALSTTQYGYIIDPMVPFTDDKGKTIKDGFVRVFVAGSSTPVITYRNFDGAANQDLIELDNSGRTKTSVIGSKGFTYKVCVYDAFHSQESPILTVDKASVIGANITAGAGATLVTGLDGLATKPDGFVDASVVGTDGYVAIDHTLVTDDLDTDAKVTAVEDDRYVPLLNEDVNDPDSKMTLGRLWQWVLGKIKSLPTTITAFRTGDVIAVDGPSGTAKMSKDDLLKETAENALGSIHSLSDTATEDDLVSGNYLALDGTNGTKKLPAEKLVSRDQMVHGLKWKLDSYPYSLVQTNWKFVPKEFIQSSEKDIVGVRIRCQFGTKLSFGLFTKGETLADDVYSDALAVFTAKTTDNLFQLKLKLQQNQGIWIQISNGSVRYAEVQDVAGTGIYYHKDDTNENRENLTAYIQSELVSDFSVLGSYLKQIGLTTKPDGFVDASVIGTDGYVALDHTLVTDDLDTDAKATAVENDRYIPLLNEDVNDPDSKITLERLWQWVLGKISNIATTITSFRSGDYIAVDGPSGTAKMGKDDLLNETAENALGSIHSLSDTATDADIKVGNYFVLDGSDGKKKLPAKELVSSDQMVQGLKWKLDSYPYALTLTTWKVAPKEFIQSSEKDIVGVRIRCQFGTKVSFGLFTKGATLADDVYSDTLAVFTAKTTDNLFPLKLKLQQNQGIWFQIANGSVRYAEVQDVAGTGIYYHKDDTNENRENLTAYIQSEIVSDFSVLGSYLKEVSVKDIVSADDFILSSYPNNLLAGYYWANSTSVVEKPVSIRAIKIKATPNASSTVSYGIFTLTGNFSVSDFSAIIGSANVSADANGEATIYLDELMQLNAGQAIYLVGSTFLKYSATSLGGCYYIHDDGSSTEVNNNQAVEVGISYIYGMEGCALEKEVQNIQSEIGTIKEKEKEKQLVLVSKTYSSDLTDVSMTNWAADIANKCFTNSGYDISNPLKINKFFCIDYRRLSLEFSTSGNPVVFFGFSTELSNYKEASFGCVDFVAGKIKIFEHTTTNIVSSSSLVLASQTNFTKSNVITDKYLIEFERGKNWSSIISVYNMTRQKALLGRLVYSEFKAGRPAPKQGFMYGFPIVFTTDATISLYKICVSAPCYDNNRLYIAGDSITEGYGSYTSEDTWSRKACAAVGKSVVSAKSGGTLGVLQQLIVSEIPKVKPKTVLIAFGHNDVWNVSDYTTFTNNLNSCITSLQSLGIKVALACMPRTTDAAVNTVVANEIIKGIAEENDLPLIRFDIATSTDYELNEPVNRSLFFDAAHPNEQGYLKMFIQFTADYSEYIVNNE